MSFLVTGASGFIGRRLVARLQKMTETVVGLDAAPSPGFDACAADITSIDLADLIPADTKAVIHLAALSRDCDCKGNALNAFNVNVLGTLNLLEAAKARGVKQFIFASSEWVYGDFLPGEVKDEDTPIDLMSVASEYALSKLVSEANLRQNFAHSPLDTTILRFGIIYGPRKENWSAVEALHNAVATRDRVEVGSLETGRCFIHIDDIVDAVAACVGLPGLNTLNVQGRRLVTLGEIIERSKQMLGRAPEIAEKSRGNPSVRQVNGEKITRLTGWAPAIDIEAGLRSLRGAL